MIAESIAQKYPWITVHKRTDRGYRDVGCGNVEAFHSGLSQVQIEDFDFIGKIDGDVVIKPSYLDKLIQLFRNDPLLGIASGWIKKEKAQPFAPLDPARLYRSSCFKEIGGVVNSPGHEIIDIYDAMRNGWKTQVFLDDSIEIIHLRRMGSSQNGFLHGRFRDGKGCYVANCHPFYFLARAIKLSFQYPYFVGGIVDMWGYISSWLLRMPQYGDAEFRKFVHRFQISQIVKTINRFFSRNNA